MTTFVVIANKYTYPAFTLQQRQEFCYLLFVERGIFPVLTVDSCLDIELTEFLFLGHPEMIFLYPMGS